MILTSEEVAGEIAEERQAEPGEYGLHIRLAREMQPTQLAYEMGDISKPTLAELINLFIGG